MDRIWQWAWDRHGPRYSWAFCGIGVPILMQIYLLMAVVVVALEGSGHYVEAVALTALTLPIFVCVTVLFSRGEFRLVEQWAAGRDVPREEALRATYTWARRISIRAVWTNALYGGLLLLAVGAIAGASGWRLGEYAVVGTVLATGVQVISMHSYIEGAVRPARVALVDDAGIGDTLPRFRPTFATWSNLTVLAAAFTFATAGGVLAIAFGDDDPALPVLIGVLLTVFFAVPMTVGAAFSLSLQPIRDLAAGTERLAKGDYGKPLPVVQDDDLGALVASFNRAQAGLAERQRLQGAFGTYVDPQLATRLLEQGDYVFSGERREVTVMFVDIRDFTAWAEANTAEDAVARLNVLFEIVVPAVVQAGGHVNKFLGDGALAVFGAPNDLAGHADRGGGSP